LEGNPPEGAGAGRTRADTAEGNNSSIGINDRKVSKKQGRRNKLVDGIVAHYSGCGISDQDLAKAAAALLGIAKKHLRSGKDFNELVNAGMLGLAIAIDKYQRGSNNGLSAHAVSWIDGEIKDFVTNSYYVVMPHKARLRNERGKNLPNGSYIEHFGNVAIGDGQLRADLSSNAELANDGEHGDDEAGGGTFLDEVVDRSLEDITGDRWWRVEQRLGERESRILLGKRRGLTNKEIGAELRTSGEAVRQALVATTRKLRHAANEADLFAWLDHDAKAFRREFDEYCRKGIGHLYRGRQQPRMSRSLIAHNKLYVEPAWTKHKETGHCICLKCCPTKLGPSECYTSHKAKFSTFDRAAAGWAPKKTNSKDPSWISTALGYSISAEKDDDKGPQAWTGWKAWKRAPQPKWKVKARKTTKALPRAAKFRRPNIRHVDYKGIPLEAPVRLTKPKQSKRDLNRASARHQREGWVPEVPFVFVPIDIDRPTNVPFQIFLTQRQSERSLPWSKPTVSTLASLCYSSDVSLTPLSPPPVTTTAVRPLTCAKLLQRNSSATA
jgi:RNA polymerase sigma-32 factor